MSLFATLLFILLAFAILDTVAAFALIRLARNTKPRPVTLTERAFVQVCIAVSALLVAIPTIPAIPAALKGDHDPSGTVWLLLASLIVKSLPTAYWSWLWWRHR